jgi:hypothetical protein
MVVEEIHIRNTSLDNAIIKQQLSDVPWRILLGKRKLEELQDKDGNSILLTFDKYKESGWPFSWGFCPGGFCQGASVLFPQPIIINISFVMCNFAGII